MGKPTGFLEFGRRLPEQADALIRVENYKEIYLPQSREVTEHQASRCMDCGVPVCQQGCPLGNMIPDWNDYVYRERWKRAYERLIATNCFPEFTGRLCPAPCEKSCVLNINQDPVTIEQIEKEIIEHAFAEGWVETSPPSERSGKSVAIVGSGPAGLAAAYRLNAAGHSVVVFERDEEIGGMLRFGIPDFKLEKWIIDRRVGIMKSEGVQFRPSTPVGNAPSWADLQREFDAVLIATGAQEARELACEGRELSGVHQAMEFLTRQNRINANLIDASASGPDAENKHVVILGGGDTGSDCLGTCHRQGAKSVAQIELFPEPPRQPGRSNPWPQWPMVSRTSSSHDEGGKRKFGLMTQELLGTEGKLTALRLAKVEIVGGQPKAIKGSELEVPADMLLLAIGFTGPRTGVLVRQLGVELGPRGEVRVDKRFATSVPGVYSAGDSCRGASLIVWAIADGQEAARAIDQDLRQSSVPHLPTKGRDAPFGGR
ncbi:MAG: glutamate synthase subunit beta [Myxococcales bacterium]|nr:glutamate synthase subunit beta [Myxococcales bacterium]